MKSKVVLLLVAAVVAVSSVVGGTATARADVNVYTTPGTHTVNGREWKTTCEAYSQTQRCRTEIKATQVSQVQGRFVVRTDWVFNNLTYLPSSRSLWKNNPLGYVNTWTADDGRKWYTECDNATTGNNGCRSYAQAKFIESFQVNGVWDYRWTTRFVFNSIVMFTTPNPSPVVHLTDTNLLRCINDTLGRPSFTKINRADAAKVKELECDAYGITDLVGLERFTNLEALYLDENTIRDLGPLKGLRKLEELSLFDNYVANVSPLATITSLDALDLARNAVEDVAPLAKLTNLVVLDLTNNHITKVAPLAQHPSLILLGLYDNPITDGDSLQSLIDDGCVVVFDEPLS